MGWLRLGVGVVLIAAPGPFLRLTDEDRATGTAVLLLRTIGIRDLAIGLGTIRAARNGSQDELRAWTRGALASDSLDVVASVASAGAIGVGEALGAAVAAVTFAGGDLVALRQLDRGPDPASTA
jgi:hypothetical protein